jgi:hypothetical protein
MKRTTVLAIAAASAFAIFSVAALGASAQFAEANNPAGVAVAPLAPGTMPAKPDGPLGALAVAPQPQQSGGIISLGPVTGNPQVDQAAQDLVNALVAAAMGWLFWVLKTKLGVSTDKDMRDALTAAAQRQASSLVADGKVSLNGKAIIPDEAALLKAVAALQKAAPDAIAHFGISDPQHLADRIVDMIPHVPAMAPAVASAHAVNGGAPLPPQPQKETPP